MNSKSVRSAVIIQPPLDQWPQIQEFREKFDKAFIRWMPHINLLYPFVQANDDVVGKITKVVTKIAPFKFSFFEHSANSCTLYLDPHPIDAIVKLQKALEAVFPDCNDLSVRGNGKFSPHLTIGQFSGAAATKEKIAALTKNWKDISFTVDSIHIIARSDSDPFSIIHTIPLGATSEKKETPTKMRKSNKEADEANSFAEIVKHVEREGAGTNAVVLLDVQQIKREGAPPNLKTFLFNRDRFPGVVICAISPTESDTIVRCNICDRMVGKWEFETHGDILSVCGDFETLSQRFTYAHVTSLPVFTLPQSLSQFSSHFGLPPDTSHEDFTFATSSRVIPSPEEEVLEVTQRVKRWMKKMGNLPTSKSKFNNATRNLRMFKGVVDSGAVLQRILSEQKLKFCTPCKNYSILPEAYKSGKARLQENDEVGKIAAKTVDWLCHQRRVPPNVTSLRTQIETFGFTKEVDSEKVWQVLVEEGIVSSDNPINYNLAAIHVDERPARNPLFPGLEIPKPKSAPAEIDHGRDYNDRDDYDREDDRRDYRRGAREDDYDDDGRGGYDRRDDYRRDDREYDRRDDRGYDRGYDRRDYERDGRGYGDDRRDYGGDYERDDYESGRGDRRDDNERGGEYGRGDSGQSAYEKKQQAAITDFDKIINTAAKSTKPAPCESFDDLGVTDNLLRGIYSFGLEKPSQIQQRAIPAMMKGKDTVVQAQAGTGKTLALLIAVLAKIQTNSNTIQSIILVPTRELAAYVYKTLLALGEYLFYNN